MRQAIYYLYIPDSCSFSYLIPMILNTPLLTDDQNILLARSYCDDHRHVIQNRLGASPLRLQIGRNADPTCPNVPQKSDWECGGQSSTCWSPGVRDTDCPSHGLCCFNGCVNMCQGPPPSIPR